MDTKTKPVLHFVRHLVEMCAAMCLGMAVLDVLFFGGAALLGYPNLLVRAPELAVVVVAVNMTVPMAAWMRHRGHAWRPIGEMSTPMFVEAILLIAVAWLGVLPRGSLLIWQHALMLPAMVIPMLLRLDVYTGRMGYLTPAQDAVLGGALSRR